MTRLCLFALLSACLIAGGVGATPLGSIENLRRAVTGIVFDNTVATEINSTSLLFNSLQAGPSPYLTAAQPSLVIAAKSTEDVLKGVIFGLQNKMKVAVRGWGHLFSAAFLAQDTILIDLSQLQEVTVDEKAGLVHVGPGANAGHVLKVLLPLGLYVPVASEDHVGMAGFLLGGGYGDNGKQYGLGCDNVVNFEVVDVRGGPAGTPSIMQANAQENSELFWALKGAGANLALVTRFTLRTQKFSPSQTATSSVFAMSKADQALRWWAKFQATTPNTLQSSARMTVNKATGDMALTIENRVFAPVTGTAVDAQGFLDATAAFANTEGLSHTQTATSYEALRTPNSPSGTAFYTADITVAELSDAVIDILTHAANTATSAQSYVSVQLPLDAGSNPAGAAGPIGFRGSFLVSIWSVWSRSEAGAAADGDVRHVEWARSAVAALRPYTQARYANTMMLENSSDTQECYPAEAWLKIQAVKAAYDPFGLFRDLDYSTTSAPKSILARATSVA